MEDKLKQWVSSQREEFEIHDFDLDAGWDKISEGLNGKAIEKFT